MTLEAAVRFLVAVIAAAMIGYGAAHTADRWLALAIVGVWLNLLANTRPFKDQE